MTSDQLEDEVMSRLHRMYGDAPRVTSSELVEALREEYPSLLLGDLRAAVVRCIASGKIYVDPSWVLRPARQENQTVVEHVVATKVRAEELVKSLRPRHLMWLEHALTGQPLHPLNSMSRSDCDDLQALGLLIRPQYSATWVLNAEVADLVHAVRDALAARIKREQS